MKKYILFLGVVLFLCVSCGKPSESDAMICDNRIWQVYDAIEKRENDQIKTLFSNNVINNYSELDASVEKLFSFIKGKPTEWKREEPPVVYDYVEDGKKQKHYTVWFLLKTDIDDYLVFISDWPIDQLNSDNEGLLSLKIIEADDESKLNGTIEEWGGTPGIHIGV